MVISRALNAVRRVRAALRDAPPAATPDPAHLADQRVADILAGLIDRASAAAGVKDYHGAALLFAEALRLQPDHFGVAVQCGHMFKESGELATAETYYLTAQRMQPDDADLALQLGHFYKVAGRLQKAEAAYCRAVELVPGWADPSDELAALQGRTRPPEALSEDLAVDFDRLVPELFPRQVHELRRTYVDCVVLRRLGARRERGRWGMASTLRGIEAIRGFCIASSPIVLMTIAFNGRVVHTGAPEAHALDGGPEGQGKYVFNVWLDFSGFETGPYQVDFAFTDAGGTVRAHREYVVVAPPLSEADLPEADGVITLPPGADGDLEAVINRRPSVVRPATGAMLASPSPRNVLVMRTDQLGDMVTSIPAVRRLREILPKARIVGLLTAGNAEFAATLDIFDEIIVADFPDDPLERRRIMGPQVQEALRRRLAAHEFDIAIDLAESAVSRPLLLLSGARFLYGFHDRDWPWLDGGFEGATHDRKNHLEIAAQSTKVRALIERLGSTLQSHAEVIRRPGLTRARLEPFGVSADDRYAVFHTGARIAFSRWPHYPQLASLILQRTGLKVILITDDLGLEARLPQALRDSGRFKLLDKRLAFDDFDALLSFCAVFVGNDSGPKHLAALRGSAVVSIHSSRINWSEWGQELTGSIISRKVPCAGCAIFHDEDECGKGFACITGITAEEVYEAVARWL